MPSPQHASSPYASPDPGFPALSINELLVQHTELIARIKLCHGSDRATFDQSVLTLIERYARLVHLLPATPDNYFCAPGGLLRLGMEVAFFSLQGTDAHIFSGRSTISARRHLEPRWGLATFIAGLCSEAHRVLTHVIVTDGTGAAWPGYLHTLSDWLTAQHADRYFLRWRPNAIETRGLGLFALAQVVPPSVMQYLAEDNSVIVPHLMASISGISVYRERNVLDELVRRSLALVIDRNLVANADRHGTPPLGSHLERYLVNALRHLASANSAWQVNREKSRVWLAVDGLFLVWPHAAEDIQKLLDAEQLQGIPKTPATIMEVLLSAGVFVPTASGQLTWTIQPPGSKIKIEAVKLASVAILFAGMDPQPAPLAEKLTRMAGVSTPVAPAKAPITQEPPTTTEPNAQMPLIPIEGARPDEQDPVTQAPTQAAAELAKESEPTPPASFTLQAPMRLNPIVRDVLIEVIHTLNTGAGPAKCCTVAHGLFVPVSEFERRGLQPSLVLRALTEVRMLARISAKAPPTSSRDFNGTPTVGLTINPRFIGGLELAGFALPADQGP
jgi:conjugal transfer pilus assembly protein TraI